MNCVHQVTTSQPCTAKKPKLSQPFEDNNQHMTSSFNKDQIVPDMTKGWSLFTKHKALRETKPILSSICCYVMCQLVVLIPAVFS